MGATLSELAFPVPPRNLNSDKLLARPDIVWLQTSGDEQVPAVHIRHSQQSYFTLLYSNRNAVDLGGQLKFLDCLAEFIGCDVFAYEYVGYGLSDGEASEQGCYDAINAAYAHLVSLVDPEKIVLFGDSIGSGPAVDLASRTPEIGGLVLSSAMRSGAYALFGKVPFGAYHFDIFRSYEKIGLVECPVLVMHGTKDEAVPFEDGEALYELCRRPVEPLWVEGRGHHDIPVRIMLTRVASFCDELRLQAALRHVRGGDDQAALRHVLGVDDQAWGQSAWSFDDEDCSPKPRRAHKIMARQELDFHGPLASCMACRPE